MNTTITFNQEEIPHVIGKLKEVIAPHFLITFKGPLGAGKTTLIKELLRVYGVKDLVTSPTFTYLNVYANENGDNFYHFDLYRLTGTDQFLEMGFDEFLQTSNAKVFIEWPERIASLLPERVCAIALDYYGADQRSLIVETKL